MEGKENIISSDSIGYFSFARGFGIICVLLGHSILLLYPMTFTDKPFGNLPSVYGGSIMAMFFMISGYSFRSRRICRCVKTQIKLLLKPYWITVGCIIGAKLVLAVLHQRSFWLFGGQYIFSYLFAINRGIQGGYSGTILGLEVNNVAMMWFIWALFGGWVIYNAITRINSIKLRHCLVAVCVCSGVGLTYVSKVWVFVFPQMLQTVGFIFLGHMIREHHLIERRLSPAWYIVLGIPAAVTIIWGGVDMYTCVWKLGLLDYLGISSLGFFFIRFFVWLTRREKKRWNAVYDLVSNIGANTQIILCIHAFDEKIIPWSRLDSFFTGKYWMGCIVYSIIRCFFVICAYKIIRFIDFTLFRGGKKHARIRLDIQD